MKKYVVLLRGVNVGGKSKVVMTELKTTLEELGFVNVSTYIASGNVILESDKSASEIKILLDKDLPKRLKIESAYFKVLVLTQSELQKIVDDKPKGFGEEPVKYHTDVLFLIDFESSDAMPIFSPREGVDMVWPGKRVVYSQRLSAQRTKSRLNKIMLSPLYKSMTIRTWNTTVKLLELLNK